MVNEETLANSQILFWVEWPWEWFLTLRVGNQRYDRLLKKYRIDLAVSEGIQLAYWGVFVHYPNPHLHIMMLGRNRAGKVLSDVDMQKWEREWGGITHETAKIEPVYEAKGVLEYIVKINMGYAPHEELIPYNTKLLKRLKIK